MIYSPVWDDHEVADNTYRDGSSVSNDTSILQAGARSTFHYLASMSRT
jgi:phosphodiesterase/alkaline phosphatase D-like protein